jgi:hypothetical protein
LTFTFFFSSQSLKDAKFPKLILHGTADELVRYVHGEDLKRKIGGALVSFDGVGHGINLQKAIEVNRALDKHIRKVHAGDDDGDDDADNDNGELDVDDAVVDVDDDVDVVDDNDDALITADDEAKENVVSEPLDDVDLK